MPPSKSSSEPIRAVIHAGVFTGALLAGHPRHAEARPLVEWARRGELAACTTAGILSEVYAALTWERAQPRHSPADASEAVRLLVAPRSQVLVLDEGAEVALRALELARRHGLTARRVPDARFAAAALVDGFRAVYTYDLPDWTTLRADGIEIIDPSTETIPRQS